MVPENLQVLAKFGLSSICSQNLDECSFARARKIFAIARMLGFSLKFARLLEISYLVFCRFFGTEINAFLHGTELL